MMATETVIVGGVERPSAEVPDWSREEPAKYWDPSRRLIRVIRRYNHWSERSGLLASLMRKICVIRYRFWTVVTASEVGLASKHLGGGFMMPHPAGCMIGARYSHIGPNLWIGSGVKFVNKSLKPNIQGRDKHFQVGGSVLIGTGAILLGPLSIGDYAIIGAGAVVMDDVPARHLAVGNPARMIPLEKEPHGKAGESAGSAGAPELEMSVV